MAESDSALPALVVVVLTFNSASVIEDTLLAGRQLTNSILVVDSGSTDATVQIAEKLGCRVLSRPFNNYSDQRNWSIHEIGMSYSWQLHLDADEMLDTQGIASIQAAIRNPGDCQAFMIRRCTYFGGKRLRFGGTTTWHMRLFKSGVGACEDRLYDQHFVATGKIGRLRGLLHDKNVGNLSEWIVRHNRWSDMEAAELSRTEQIGQQVEAKLSSDPRERKRYYKGLYYRAPLLSRGFAYFCFRYFLQFGILDGSPGFLYAFFQALWFRILVDAKLIEKQLQHK